MDAHYIKATSAAAVTCPERVKHRLWQLASLLVLLGVSQLAVAAPPPQPSSFTLPHQHSARTAMMNLAAAALAVSGPDARQLQDEPRRSSVGFRDAPQVSEVEGGMSERPGTQFPIQWRQGPEIVDPAVVSLIKNYHRNGLPIVHLWEKDKNLVALGLNNHGLPGIYFTRHFE